MMIASAVLVTWSSNLTLNWSNSKGNPRLPFKISYRRFLIYWQVCFIWMVNIRIFWNQNLKGNRPLPILIFDPFTTSDDLNLRSPRASFFTHHVILTLIPSKVRHMSLNECGKGETGTVGLYSYKFVQVRRSHNSNELLSLVWQGCRSTGLRY